ncbi:hypothetical protein [Flavobacterium aquicola]|uniref:Uncharacterized protein n=1 Tax=Flavobacterium aquicola TaxID=1682742 RepID=A0A3E0EQW2_9FLAO|nr:hypothetical protein [Flavobacterium aquicola]REG99759.1 hypothetical protein C8P67_104394 [Flavobacterium aquicola]
MKIKLLLLISLLISNFSFCQIKKELFYDYNLDEISQEKFISQKNSENYALSYENETSIKTYLIEIETYGKLNYFLFESIKKYLITLKPKTTFKKNNYILINYIDNDPIPYREGAQVPWDIMENNISKAFKKKDSVSQFYIINPNAKDLYYYHGDKLKWETDKDHFLRDKFFTFQGLNGGFLIIDKEGNYFSQKGEYSKKDVLDKMKKMHKVEN